MAKKIRGYNTRRYRAPKYDHTSEMMRLALPPEAMDRAKKAAKDELRSLGNWVSLVVLEHLRRIQGGL